MLMIFMIRLRVSFLILTNIFILTTCQESKWFLNNTCGQLKVFEGAMEIHRLAKITKQKEHALGAIHVIF